MDKAEAVAKSIGGHAMHVDVAEAASVEKLAVDCEAPNTDPSALS